MSDFNYGILEERSHRPWPMRDGPWVMTQTWNDLLFAHWRVDAAALRTIVPEDFTIDTFEGQAWIAVVPFHMTNVGPRLAPSIPGVSAFPELNVRTYVRVDDKPGVYFFSLDAGSSAAVATARTLLRLPYYTAQMSVRAGWSIQYNSRRTWGPSATFQAQYAPAGSPSVPSPGSLEYFLTERYCLYAIDLFHRPYRLEIHHPPWPLQPARAEILTNTMTQPLGIELAGPGLLHFSKRQDVVCWMPQATRR
ncbi:MAG TPA: DUF2071 domain-containing protein [Vicinamibacterales bacterium]|jgi:uncharacterized protein YqjF (DUF2071 family)|nr:DUF2071 domain-containing protein [Vicinamibacterales bacterium]